MNISILARNYALNSFITIYKSFSPDQRHSLKTTTILSIGSCPSCISKTKDFTKGLAYKNQFIRYSLIGGLSSKFKQTLMVWPPQ